MPLLTRSLSSSGRLAAALALVVLLTPAVALWASGGPPLAQNVPSLGVDMAPGNNTADFVGAVQTCSEAQVGDQIAQALLATSESGRPGFPGTHGAPAPQPSG